MKKDNWLLVV